MKSKAKSHWVTDPSDDWPQCIWKTRSSNLKVPIWVWGDKALAELIVRLLNRHEGRKAK